MPKSFNRRVHDAAMRAQLRTMFEQAGTTFERREDGRVTVTNWPQARSAPGGRSFLRDESASFNAGLEQDRASCAAEGHQSFDGPAGGCRRCGAFP